MSFLSNILSRFKPKKQDVFCMMPWVHFHVTQHGTVTPCCQAPWQEDHAFGNINKQSIKEIWQGERIKQFRKNILNNKPDTRCQQCYNKEQQGFTSLRQITNQKYSQYTDKINLKPTQPVYFDIRFSNTCNLRCRMCGPWSSSSWYNDALQLGMINETSKPLTYAFNNSSNFLNELTSIIDNVEEFYFAGGEPLVMQEHYNILENLIKKNKTNVQLTYNTNFSGFTFKEYNVFDLWKHFKNISIAASLDASGLRGELLRKNIKWNDVIANRRLIFKELPHIEFTVSPTINAYNLLHLPNFHLEWVNQQLINVEDFVPTLLVNPSELNIINLPKSFKNKAFTIYKEHIVAIEKLPFKNKIKFDYMLSQFKNVLSVLQKDSPTDNDSRAFVNHINKLDKLRIEETFLVFPELKELL